MKTFFWKLGLLAALAFAPLIPLSRFYDQQLSRYTAEKGIWNLSLKNKEYDYVVIGSSRALNVVSIDKIDSCLQIKGVNLAVGGTAYAENLLMIKKFYKAGNKTKLLLIQVDLGGMIDPYEAFSHPFNDQNYLFLVGDPEVDSIIRENTNRLKHPFRRFVPFFKYAEYNNIFSLNTVFEGFPQTADFQQHGGSALPAYQKHEKMKEIKPQMHVRHLDPAAIINLKALVQTAQNQGTQVVFFTAPTYSEYLHTEPQNDLAHDSIMEIAKSYGISCFNFEKNYLSYNKSFFRDVKHLNHEGVNLLAVMLADSLEKNILMPKKEMPSK